MIQKRIELSLKSIKKALKIVEPFVRMVDDDRRYQCLRQTEIQLTETLKNSGLDDQTIKRVFQSLKCNRSSLQQKVQEYEQYYLESQCHRQFEEPVSEFQEKKSSESKRRNPKATKLIKKAKKNKKKQSNETDHINRGQDIYEEQQISEQKQFAVAEILQ